MDTEKLKQFESNPEILKKYLGASAFGKNKIIYLPIVLAFALLLFILLAVTQNLVDTIGKMSLIIMGVGVVVCLFAIKFIYDSTKKKMAATITSAPTCIGKIIVGNDNQEAYHYIYTTGKYRHSEDFIENMAQKINAIENPQTATERKVANFFRPDFISPGKFGERLPMDFTDNEEVWTKQLAMKISVVDPQIKQRIKDEGGTCKSA